MLWELQKGPGLRNYIYFQTENGSILNLLLKKVHLKMYIENPQKLH